MNTVFLLMAEFESAQIPLSAICDKYLGMSHAQAKRAAATQQLPFPVHRARTSQKSPWLVNVQDLADHLDATRAAAHREWRDIHQARSAS